jgi:putative MATE family efflux protein
MGAALRGAGEVKAPMQVAVISLVANIVLAPVLIAGVGTGHPMGVAGAGLATFLSVLLSAVLLLTWVRRRHDILDLDRSLMTPDIALWKRLLGIGLPSGGEFLLLSAYSMLVYALIKSFGNSAQAGFGVGMRIMQTGFMPALAVAFSIAPIAGQNLGAGRVERVREVFKAGVTWVSLLMIVFIGLVHLAPSALLSPFASDPAVIAVGAQMLAILSTNFLASGVIQVASGMFQAIGNTLPSLIASASRIGLFVAPAMWLSKQPDFHLAQLWWLSVASVIAQLLIVLWLLRREFARKLATIPAAAPLAAESA